MALTPGVRLGVYQITAPIGEGGMGQVWRARDTKLDRDVAIKVLPEAFAHDADRLARFTREAKTLAALNHPNIAHIHGLEESGGITALVMELVEGDDLSQRIGRGAIPIDEALPIAKQIAEALEAAHEQGIIHRDLKPANIKVRPDGAVKVLDFGLAKALDQGSGIGDPFDPAQGRQGSGGAANSPTITSPAMTQAGMILGTAAYMAPEQARGKVVDKRADIWAFGAVLFEMLTGTRAFPGEDLTDTLAAVVRAEPNWTLPPTVSPTLVTYLKRCLHKDPRQRIPDVAAMRLALDGAFEIADLTSTTGSGAQRSSAWRLTTAAALPAAALAAVLVWAIMPRPTGDLQTTRFIVRTAGDGPLSAGNLPLALSPDGRDLVYAVGEGVKAQLFHHSLAGFEPRAIEGARGAIDPIFLSRGDVIGFHSLSAGSFRRMALAGGSPAQLVESVGTAGVSSGEDGTLVFVTNWGRPIHIVRPGASEAVALTRIDTAAGEVAHLWPQVLPDSRGVLFTVAMGDGSWNEAGLAVADRETGEHRLIQRGGASGRYVNSGHLVFWRGNALMAVPLDLQNLSTRGEAVRVVTNVRLHQGPGAAHFAVSEGGTLAYIQGKEESFAESFIADRSGRRLLRFDETGGTGFPSFSPDGTQIVLSLLRGGFLGVGVFDIARRQVTPVALTHDNTGPGWTSRGDRVAFASSRDGEYNWYTSRADGSGAPEPLFSEAQGFMLRRSAWSRDGRYVAYGRGGLFGNDIWVLESGTSTGRPLIATPAKESAPTFSPDGRFLAYHSDESGSIEVYVRPFPDVERRRDLISQSGGQWPVWSRDGKNVFYASEGGLMQVPVTVGTGGIPRFGPPSLVFEMSGIMNFDVSPDGNTFAIERIPLETLATEIHVVLNWFEELKRLVPVK